MVWIFKDDVKKAIKSKPILFAEICEILGISVFTLGDLLRKNDPQLTQKAVLQVVSKGLDISEEQLTVKVNKVQKIKKAQKIK